MELKGSAMAGTLESSDILVQLDPASEGGITIELESPVEVIFGEQIRKVVRDTLERFGVQNARVTLRDRGALDCVIAARVQCALFRAAGTAYDWTREDTEAWEI